MALTLGALVSDRVDCGSAATLDDLDPWTFLAWVYPTTFTNARVLFSKSGNTQIRLSGTTGDVDVVRVRAGGTLLYRTNDTPLVLNTWNFIAGVMNTAAGAGLMGRIYRGSLTAPAVERAYGLQTDASGAISSDAANALIIGNTGAATAVWQGRIAFIHLLNEELTLAQIIAQQFRPHKRALTRLYVDFHGTGTQPDLSGNQNNGAVTGATVSEHVPLPPPFGSDWYTLVRSALDPGTSTVSLLQLGSAAVSVSEVGAVAVSITQLGGTTAAADARDSAALALSEVGGSAVPSLFP